jgi:hypothetical protein
MKCNRCGFDDNGTGDFAHVCKPDDFFKTLPHGGQMQVTTDNSATLQKALAEIERLKADRATAERNENAAMVAIDRKDAALRAALDALEGADSFDTDMRDAVIAIKEAL